MNQPSEHTASAMDERLAVLIDQVTADLIAGADVDFDALAAKYPEYADQLADLRPTLAALADWGDTTAPRADSASTNAATPAALGDFRLLRVLGRGGMGVVYEAEQLSLGRRVAVKVLPYAALLDPRQLTRFKNEARAAAMLKHPNIVSVISVGTERGVHYYAMELIEGISLAEAIAEVGASRVESPEKEVAQSVSRDANEEPPSPASSLQRTAISSDSCQQPIANSQQPESTAAQALSTDRTTNPKRFFHIVARLGIQAADALHYAHQQGVIHRDVKPSNLLLDNLGDVHIADFGLARIQSGDDLTLTGDVIGTLRYMSPEQLDDETVPDQRTDVYSLGLTLYELATGHPAFDGTSREQLILQVKAATPLTPSRHANAVPRDLETIIVKAICADPSQRYASMNALSDDLQNFLVDRPIAARRRGRFSKTLHWARRNRTIAALSTFALMLLLTLAIGGPLAAIRQSRIAERLQDIVEEKASLANKNAQLAKQQSKLADQRRLQLYDSQIRSAQGAYDRNEFLACMSILNGLIQNSLRDENLRGFEWHFLDHQCRNAVDNSRFSNWSPHTAVAFSPNGRHVAAGSWDGKVIVYDSRSRDVVWGPYDRNERHHRGRVVKIKYWRDGANLLSAGQGGTLIVWDAAREKRIASLDGLSEKLTSFDLSHDGERVAVCFGQNKMRAADSTDTVVQLYRIEREYKNGASQLEFVPIRTLKIPNQSPRKVSFSCDDQTLAASTVEGNIYIWNTATWQQVRVLPNLGSLNTDIAYSSNDPNLLAAASGVFQKKWLSGDARLWNTTTGELLRTIPGHRADVRTVAFSPDGEILATGGGDNYIHAWNVETGNLIATQSAHWGAIEAVSFSPDSDVIASASRDTSIQLWSWKNSAATERIRTGAYWIHEISFSPDDSKFACADAAGWITLRDIQSGSPLWNVRLNSPEAWGLDISPDGALIVACGATWHKQSNPAGELVLLRAVDGYRMRTLRVSDHSVSCARFSPDGGRIAATLRPHVVVLDTYNGNEIWRGRHTGARRIAWSADVKWIASVSKTEDGVDDTQTIKLWDAASGASVHSIRSNFTVLAIAISPDSKYFAAPTLTQEDVHEVGLWEIPTGKLVRTFKGHTGLIWDIDFSPDGRRLATASWDEKARLWNVQTGAELLTLQDGDTGVSVVQFSHDGKTLAVAEMSNIEPTRANVRLYSTGER